MLIVFSGLPGTGKSTLARQLTQTMRAVYLRLDTVEAALVNADISVIAQGYMVLYALAQDNLTLGLPVVADCVNPLPVTREAWHNVAQNCSRRCVDIEVICSDAAEYRRRVEDRHNDEGNHVGAWKPPTWSRVGVHDYQPWTTPHLQLDTARETPQQNFEALSALLKAHSVS